MKPILFALLIICCNSSVFGQDISSNKIYDPAIDVTVQLKSAIVQAKLESKHVLVQIGGDWCPWCIKFHKFIDENEDLKTMVEQEYVYILLNIDKENPQKQMMQELNYPQRFGFPVFVVLDGNGFQLHIQDSALLEKGKTYDKSKVKQFLKHWNFMALSSDSYK